MCVVCKRERMMGAACGSFVGQDVVGTPVDATTDRLHSDTVVVVPVRCGFTTFVPPTGLDRL